MRQLGYENIIGYPVTTARKNECVEWIYDWVINGDKLKYFVCANPHSVYVAEHDEKFELALKNADLVTPDGVGMVIASKILNGNIKGRVTGSDIFFGLSSICNKRNRGRYFFLGSSDNVLHRIKEKMLVDYPGIEVVGTYSPPFKLDFSKEDNEIMIREINKANPDVLWVGMTAPKQEKWIFDNKDKLNVKFVGAIGAVFDFYVGRVKRSHPFFQKIGLEWLPRLLQEPKRLWRRNFVSNPLFLLKVARVKLKS